MTGPRSTAVPAPQSKGNRTGPREPGCEVSRIWPLFPSDDALISNPLISVFAPKATTLSATALGWLSPSRGGAAIATRMKIVTYNLNGIRARLPRLLEYLAEQRPDALCLQEIKCDDDAFPIM